MKTYIAPAMIIHEKNSVLPLLTGSNGTQQIYTKDITTKRSASEAASRWGDIDWFDSDHVGL